MSQPSGEPQDNSPPAASPPARAIDTRTQVQQFAGMVSAASRLVHLLSTRGLGWGSGMPLTDWLLLAFLADAPVQAKRVAALIGSTRPLAAQAVTRLASQDLVSAPANPDDEVRITEQGRSVLAAANEEAALVLARRLQGHEHLVWRAERQVKLLGRLFQRPLQDAAAAPVAPAEPAAVPTPEPQPPGPVLETPAEVPAAVADVPPKASTRKRSSGSSKAKSSKAARGSGA